MPETYCECLWAEEYKERPYPEHPNCWRYRCRRCGCVLEHDDEDEDENDNA